MQIILDFKIESLVIKRDFWMSIILLFLPHFISVCDLSYDTLIDDLQIKKSCILLHLIVFSEEFQREITRLWDKYKWNAPAFTLRQPKTNKQPATEQAQLLTPQMKPSQYFSRRSQCTYLNVPCKPASLTQRCPSLPCSCQKPVLPLSFPKSSVWPLEFPWLLKQWIKLLNKWRKVSIHH